MLLLNYIKGQLPPPNCLSPPFLPPNILTPTTLIEEHLLGHIAKP
jgi:hypothetical protein